MPIRTCQKCFTVFEPEYATRICKECAPRRCEMCGTRLTRANAKFCKPCKVLHKRNKAKQWYLDNKEQKQEYDRQYTDSHSVGVIEGVVAALSLPVMHISPQRWKKAAGLLGKDKDAARTLAVNLFPQMWEDLARKKDVGRADALCIAYFAAKLCAEKFTHTG